MARIGRHGDGEIDLPAGAVVIPDVAGPCGIVPETASAKGIAELGEDLRVRLAQHVGEGVEPPAVRHSDEHTARAGLGGLGDDLVENLDQHVEPFDQESHLGRERAVQEVLERFNRSEALQQRERIDRIGLSPEASTLGRLGQPVTFFRRKYVRVVMSDRRAVDAAKARDGLERGRGLIGEGERAADQACRQRAQI